MRDIFLVWFDSGFFAAGWLMEGLGAVWVSRDSLCLGRPTSCWFLLKTKFTNQIYLISKRFYIHIRK